MTGSSSQPQLVLLPGLDGTHHLFAPFLRQWSGDAFSVAYPPSLPTSYQDLLLVVRAALPTDRDFVLLGWSFSGPLALEAAVLRPERLRGVVLCASFVRKPMRFVPAWARRLAWPGLFRFSGSMAVAKTALAGRATPEVKAAIRRAHGAVPSEVMAARVREVLVVDVEQELRNCPVPILYLRSRKDRVVRAHNAAGIQRVRSDVDVRTIPGSHLALATHAEDAAREIEAFMASLPRP